MATKKANDRTPVKKPGAPGATFIKGPDKFATRADATMRGKKGR